MQAHKTASAQTKTPSSRSILGRRYLKSWTVVKFWTLHSTSYVQCVMWPLDVDLIRFRYVIYSLMAPRQGIYNKLPGDALWRKQLFSLLSRGGIDSWAFFNDVYTMWLHCLTAWCSQVYDTSGYNATSIYSFIFDNIFLPVMTVRSIP